MSSCPQCGNARGSQDCKEDCAAREERKQRAIEKKALTIDKDFESDVEEQIKIAEKKYNRKINRNLDKEPNWLRSEIMSTVAINKVKKSSLSTLKESIQDLNQIIGEQESIDLISAAKEFLLKTEEQFELTLKDDLTDYYNQESKKYKYFERNEFPNKKEQIINSIKSYLDTEESKDILEEIERKYKIFEEDDKYNFFDIVSKVAYNKLYKIFDGLKNEAIEEIVELYKK